ncbi:hypothetical protein ABPG75_006404 [Micractinium tetrahymenae]
MQNKAFPGFCACRVLVWFRRDLRVADNPALVAAVSMGEVIPVYIWAPEEEGQFQPGRCSRWWLHHSLAALDSDLRALGSRLLCFRGADSHAVLARLAAALGARAVLFNHLYDPISMVRDNEVKAALAAGGTYCQSFNADILREPWEVLDAHGKPFTCYDAFWSAHCALPYPPTPPLPVPAALPPLAPGVEAAAAAAGAVPLKDLGIMSQEEEMSNAQLNYHWTPGSAGAHRVLDEFVRSGRLHAFDRDRAKTDRASTSRLSPHIHYGEISVRHIHYVAKHQELEWARAGDAGTSVQDFLRQLGYREYSRYLSFHFPFTHERSLLEHLRAVPWRFDQRLFKAWRQGRTGYPLVDAAMREVWGTGWMHNRMRVVAASFMVKNLLLPWQWGLKHYWDALLDADLECDALGWQYVSGCMADAHEFSSTIHHHTEARRFDPDGNYVRRWLPVLARLPAKYIHQPWTAPESVLEDAGVELGVNYPFPVISQEESLAALAAADAVVQQCLRGGAGASAAAAGAAGSVALEGPFRPATDAEPAEAERLFAEHYRRVSGLGRAGKGGGRQHVLFSEPSPRHQAEGSGASEDVQSNIVLPAHSAAGTAAVARAAAAASADDLVSCAPLPSDGARSAWAGPPPGAALPVPREPQPAAAQLAWQQPLTVRPVCGSAGAGGSGAGTGHATQTGVSLGVVRSVSAGAGTGSKTQAGPAAAAELPQPPHVWRAAPSGGEEVEGARAAAAAVASQPQATNEGQEAGRHGSSRPASGGCTETVQQPQEAQEARSVPEAAAVAQLQQQGRQQGQAAASSHKRQRARSPSPPPDNS